MWTKQMCIKKQRQFCSDGLIQGIRYMMTVNLYVIVRPEVRLSEHMCIGYFSVAVGKKYT